MAVFVNRVRELRALERWWSEQTQSAVVWGRRRVGKTALIQQFMTDKPSIFHTGAGRSALEELAQLAERVHQMAQGTSIMGVATMGIEAIGGVGPALRDLVDRPYVSWDDALDDLAGRAQQRPLLLVLDEFPELVASSPELPKVLRAFLDRSAGRTRLRILLCGSAVRYMQAIQEEREALYGRFDLSLGVHPFAPHEAALMLERLSPQNRALVYGIVGGVPMYLAWWDQGESVKANISRLVCQPGARLLTEGDFVLRADLDRGEFAHQVLHAIANGVSEYGRIKDRIRAEPARTLDRLVDLRLIERLAPVGEPERSRLRHYRLADPFLAFHLGVASRYHTEIERGLGAAIVPVLVDSLNDHMGGVWEEVFRQHLRRLANDGRLGVKGNVVAVGSWWDRSSNNQLDALVLAERSATPVLAGEAKWTKFPDARRMVDDLRRKVADGLHLEPDALGYAVCARDGFKNLPEGTLAFTAADVFGLPGEASMHATGSA